MKTEHVRSWAPTPSAGTRVWPSVLPCGVCLIYDGAGRIDVPAIMALDELHGDAGGEWHLQSKPTSLDQYSERTITHGWHRKESHLYE